jgi:hypothetical protein
MAGSKIHLYPLSSFWGVAQFRILGNLMGAGLLCSGLIQVAVIFLGGCFGQEWASEVIMAQGVGSKESSAAIFWAKKSCV